MAWNDPSGLSSPNPILLRQCSLKRVLILLTLIHIPKRAIVITINRISVNCIANLVSEVYRIALCIWEYLAGQLSSIRRMSCSASWCIRNCIMGVAYLFHRTHHRRPERWARWRLVGQSAGFYIVSAHLRTELAVVEYRATEANWSRWKRHCLHLIR